MLVGQPPFTDDEPLAMLTAHVSRDAPPFAEIAPDLQVPPGLEEVIQRGLAKISAERIASATDYVQMLDDVARAAGVEMPMMPRMSGQLAIPSGPHSLTPTPGFMMTPPPMAYATPNPGSATPYPQHHTPFPRNTPSPGELGHAATQSLDGLPQAARMASIADVSHQPLPARTKLIGVVIALAAAGLAGYFIFGHTDKPSGGSATGVTVPVANPTVDPEILLKAALHDLENGKTCADRKAAIPSLVQVGGDRAIAALKKARYRMRGGVLGLGDSNTNACLKPDADKALQALGAAPR
jgi:hypothetical protein